jgi:hypothetical protein
MVPFYRRESNDCHNTECSSEEANFQPGEIRIMRYTRSYHKKKKLDRGRKNRSPDIDIILRRDRNMAPHH